jgi:hypothetical protein
VRYVILFVLLFLIRSAYPVVSDIQTIGRISCLAVRLLHDFNCHVTNSMNHSVFEKQIVEQLAIQFFPISWNPMIHYCFHKTSILDSIPRKVNPVYILKPYGSIFKITLILSSYLRRGFPFTFTTSSQSVRACYCSSDTLCLIRRVLFLICARWLLSFSLGECPDDVLNRGSYLLFGHPHHHHHVLLDVT